MDDKSQLYSLKTIFHRKLFTVLETVLANSADDVEGLFAKEMPQTLYQECFETVEQYDRYKHVLGYKTTNLPVSQGIQKDSILHIKLGAFLQLLNLTIPRRADKVPLYKFDISPDIHRYRTIPDHISVDPTVAILPNIDYDARLDSGVYRSTYILDIYVSIPFLLSTLDELVSNGTSVDMLTYVERVLTGIQNVTGGINALDLQYFEETSEFAVVDRERLEKNNQDYPKFNILGTGTVVKDVRLVSKLSPTITSALAISAQSSPYTATDEAIGFSYLNKGLIDRIFPEKSEDKLLSYKNRIEQNNTGNSDKIKITREELEGTLRVLIQRLYVPGENGKIVYAKENTDSYSTIFRNYYKLLIGIDNNPSVTKIIPFELQMTLEGISGLKVMEAFVIDENILPYPYRTKLTDSTRVAFLITGLEHTIANTGWETKIKAQIFLSDKAAEEPRLESPFTIKKEAPRDVEAKQNSAPVKGNPLLAEVLKAAGYNPGTISYEMALAIGSKEGWNPNANNGVGSRSYRNNNPGNLDYSDSLRSIDPGVTLENNPYGANRFARFTTAELGAKALVETKIKRWADGRMPVTAGNQSLLSQAGYRQWQRSTPPTFREFFYTYAPPNENNTEGYVLSVVKNLRSKYPNESIVPDSTILPLITKLG